MEHPSTVSYIQMTRILHLALLLLPTVLSSYFNLGQCSKEEFTCIIQDICQGSSPRKRMVDIDKEATNYKADACKVHVMIRQYTTNNYLIRFITKNSNEIKIEQDQKTFGCNWNNEKIVFSSETYMKMKLISKEKSGEEKLCEFSVENTNGDKIFPQGKGMFIVLDDNGEKLTLDDGLISRMETYFGESKYQCNPNSIQMDHDDLKDHKYSIQPINATYKMGECAAPYKLAFIDSEGKVQEGTKIDCAQEVKDACDNSNPPTCEWKYHIKRRNEKTVVASTELKAACRQKVCKMCENPKPSCEGLKCEKPKFSEGDCHSLQCPTLFEEKSFVAVDGENKTFGTFECVLENDNKAVWKFNNKLFTKATCFDTIECDNNKLRTLKCADEEKKEGCPAENSKDHEVKCPPGFNLVVIVGGKTIEKPKVQCDKTKGYYHYSEEGGNSPHLMEKKEDGTVNCALPDSVKAATGLHFWQLLLIIPGALILIVLLILCIFCVHRSKKKEEERKALLNRNNSGGPSSTESGKPQTNNRNLVHLQPCSTAKPISSEQISEATAIERTKKEYAEKTMIEPTLDLATAYSHDKSKQSKRESGSIEAEIIDDGKRSRSQRSEKSGPDRDESGPSAKASMTSKKESGKTDNLKPKKFELNEKEKKIAQGVWRRNEDYPTMADIESDWDDAKDGKPPSKQRTATKDIPTADTPSARVAKIPDLNEKTAEMERLIAQPLSPLKMQRVTASEDLLPPKSRESDSRVSVRRNNNKIAKLMTTLDATQEQK